MKFRLAPWLLLLSSFCVLTLGSAEAYEARCDPADIRLGNTPSPPMIAATVRQFDAQRAALTQPADLIFFGDSLTAGWPGNIMQRSFPDYRILNLGTGGDRVQELLWRVEHFSLDVASPKYVVLWIGTNNLGSKQDVCTIESGVDVLVQDFQHQWPKATLVILGIIKRGDYLNFREDDRRRANAYFSQLAASDNRIRYVDLDHALPCPTAEATCPFYKSDMLHLNAASYVPIGEVLAKIIQ